MAWVIKRLLLFPLIFSFFGGTAWAQEPTSSWQQLARRVGPSEKDRHQNIEQLQSLPELEKQLINALDSKDRALSLDVIGALRLSKLSPQLKSRVKEDRSGFLTLTLNSLISKQSEKEIIGHYLELLSSPETLAPATLVAMLEPMNRLHPSVNQEMFRSLLKKLSRHESPEVRSEILNILRSQLFQNRLQLDELEELLTQFLDDVNYSLRLQTYSLIQEFGGDVSLASPLLHIAEKRCKAETASEALYTCHQTFSLPYGQKRGPLLTKGDSVDIYVVFGYKDARPSRFVGDRHERLAFVQRILSPCRKQDQTSCGFTRSAKYSDVFYKQHHQKTIRMLVVQSSVSTDDEVNRNNPFQKIQSDYAGRVFAEGLRRGHVVFYNGHSRFGGGPDFAPPHLSAKGHVSTAFYQRSNVGFKDMMKALAASANNSNLKTLGLFSCSSTQHFENGLKKLTSARLITDTSALHYSEALNSSLNELNTFLNKTLM